MSDLSKKSQEKVAVVSNLTSGGAVVYMNALISELSKRNKIIFYSPKPFVSQTKYRFFRLLEYTRYIYFYLPRYYKLLALQLNEEKPKKVIIFQDSYIKTPNIFKLLTAHYVHVFHEPPREFYESIFLHTDDLKDILFNFFIRLPIYFINRNNMYYANNLISNSQYSKDLLYRLYKKKSVVIYPGFKFVKHSVKTVKKHKCISVGSLLPYKGHHLVIESIGQIRKNRPTLTIVGKGSPKRKKYLMDLAKKNNVNIKIIDNLSDNELKREYLESTTYINGAQGEPFGLTSLEALGYGCNLVTNNTGGTKELAKFFKDRVFVSENNQYDMSKKILVSLKHKNYSDTDMSRFSWSKIARKIETL